MANYMAEVAALLGVELGEVFKIKTPDNKDSYYPYYYRFTENGGIECSEDNEDNADWEMGIPTILRKLLVGDVKIVKLTWKPQKDERYYTPAIAINPENMYKEFIWDNDNTDIERYNMGLVYKTKEEAVFGAKKLLAMVKEERENG